MCFRLPPYSSRNARQADGRRGEPPTAPPCGRVRRSSSTVEDSPRPGLRHAPQAPPPSVRPDRDLRHGDGHASGRRTPAPAVRKHRARRSEMRRVGKECVSKVKYGGGPKPEKKKK